MVMLSSAPSLLSDEMRAKIANNYVVSQRESRFAPFHFGAFVAFVLVTLGAVLVDYMIVTEFWTRALANEFLELPDALGTSVAFKSMQVLFATVAAHILFAQMGKFGRAVFVRVVFVLALVMLLGVGFLLALMSLPNGLAATGGADVGTSLGSALASLGIDQGVSAGSAAAASNMDEMRGYEPLFWLSSLGVVFLVVTGVAALCIHFAVQALKRVFLAREFHYRKSEMNRLAALEAEYDNNRHALSELEGQGNRRHLLWTALMRECREYERGLDEARHGFSQPQLQITHRSKLGRRLEAEPSLEPARNMERLKACEVSRDVARYEKLFDEWWERRSRNAMKAGPATYDGVREPTGELLPPVRRMWELSVEKKAAE